jgi:hypothetical protein
LFFIVATGGLQALVICLAIVLVLAIVAQWRGGR